jgi:hypothetical protein
MLARSVIYEPFFTSVAATILRGGVYNVPT